MTFTIYSRRNCLFCTRAASLIHQQGESFVSWDVEANRDKLTEMLDKVPNAKTVPQIFFGDEYVGGYEELKMYFEENKESRT